MEKGAFDLGQLWVSCFSKVTLAQIPKLSKAQFPHRQKFLPGDKDAMCEREPATLSISTIGRVPTTCKIFERFEV